MVKTKLNGLFRFDFDSNLFFEEYVRPKRIVGALQNRSLLILVTITTTKRQRFEGYTVLGHLNDTLGTTVSAKAPQKSCQD